MFLWYNYIAHNRMALRSVSESVSGHILLVLFHFNGKVLTESSPEFSGYNDFSYLAHDWDFHKIAQHKIIFHNNYMLAGYKISVYLR